MLTVINGKGAVVSSVKEAHCTNQPIHPKVLTMRFCTTNITLLVPGSESYFTRPLKVLVRYTTFVKGQTFLPFPSLCFTAVKALTFQPERYSLIKYYCICTYLTPPQFKYRALIFGLSPQVGSVLYL